MTLAVFLDYQLWSDDMNREGIIIFSKYLMDALLMADPGLRMELWIKPSQQEKVLGGYSDIIEKSRERITVFPQEILPEDRVFPRKPVRRVKSAVYRCLASALSFHKGIGQFWSDKSAVNRALYDDSRVNFLRVFNRCSEADAVYVPHFASKGAHNLNRPVFIQLHDVYRFMLLDFFIKEDRTVNNRRWAKNTKRELNRYASEGVFFVTSNGYVKDAIPKYIRVEEDHCRVVHYPAMIRFEERGNIESEKAFRERYGLGGQPYTFFPSKNRPNKNLIVLLKALKRLRDKGVVINLVTTGRMGDVKSTAAYAKRNPGLVIELGQVSEADLYPLYKYSAMVACPNLIEGPLISEQAMGALKIGGIPVAHARSMGYETALKEAELSEETADLNWFDVTDDEVLSRIMEDMLMDPGKHIAKQKSIIKVFDRRSWEKTAKEYLAMFKLMAE